MCDAAYIVSIVSFHAEVAERWRHSIIHNIKSECFVRTQVSCRRTADCFVQSQCAIRHGSERVRQVLDARFRRSHFPPLNFEMLALRIESQYESLGRQLRKIFRCDAEPKAIAIELLDPPVRGAKHICGPGPGATTARRSLTPICGLTYRIRLAAKAGVPRHRLHSPHRGNEPSSTAAFAPAYLVARRSECGSALTLTDNSNSEPRLSSSGSRNSESHV